jgi:hypothetical protein
MNDSSSVVLQPVLGRLKYIDIWQVPIRLDGRHVRHEPLRGRCIHSFDQRIFHGEDLKLVLRRVPLDRFAIHEIEDQSAFTVTDGRCGRIR